MMTRNIFFFLTVVFCSCSVSNEVSPPAFDLPYVINSDYFVKNLEYDKIKFQQLSDDVRDDLPIDRITEKHGEEFLLLLFDAGQTKINDTYLRAYYVARNNKIGLDAYFEKVYFVTYSADGKAISHIEAGGYEAYFGYSVISTSTLNEDLVLQINTLETTENMNTGAEEKKSTTKSYIINKSGEFVLRQ